MARACDAGGPRLDLSCSPWSFEDVDERLLHEVLGVVGRPAQRPGRSIEPVDVPVQSVRVQDTRPGTRVGHSGPRQRNVGAGVLRRGSVKSLTVADAKGPERELCALARLQGVSRRLVA